MGRCFDEEHVPSFNNTLGPGVPRALGITLSFAETADHLFPGRVPKFSWILDVNEGPGSDDLDVRKFNVVFPS